MDLGQIGKDDVAVGGGRLVALSRANRKLSILDPATGTLVSSTPLTTSEYPATITTAVTMTPNAILFGDAGGYIHILDPVTLSPRQHLQCSQSAIIGEIALSGPDVFVASADGRLVKLSGTGFECTVGSAGYPQNGHQAIGPGGINSVSGNLVFTVNDLSLPRAGLSITLDRTYNSQRTVSATLFSPDGTISGPGAVGGTPFQSALGPGWTHNFQASVRPRFDQKSGATLFVEDRGDGRQIGFTLTLTGELRNPAGVFDDFSFTPTGSALSATSTGQGVVIRRKSGVTREFDQTGNLLKVRDPEGNVLSFRYVSATAFLVSASGARLVSILYLSSTVVAGAGLTAPVATSTVFLDYDTQARLSRLRAPHPSGIGFITTTYFYDSNGRLADVHGAGGLYRATYSYDTNGRMIEKREPRASPGDKHLKFQYDAKGRGTQVTTPSGTLVARYSYGGTFEGNGQTIVRVPGPSGEQVTTYTYTACKELTTVSSCSSGSNNIDWDQSLNPTNLVDANGNPTTQVFDGKGNVTQSTDAKGGIFTREYDPTFNRVTRTLDENNDETIHEYDDRGNRTRTIQKVKAIPALGDSATEFITRYVHDNRGLLVKVTDPKGSRTTHSYNGNGEITSTDRWLETSPGVFTALTTKFEYDALGRRITTIDSRGVRTETVYDLEGRVTKIRNAAVPGGTALSESTMEYDDLGRMIKKIDGAGRFIQTTYNEKDQPTKTEDGEGTLTEQIYDAGGLLIATKDGKGNTTAFSYNQGCRLSQVTDPENGTIKLAYDNAGNMVKVTDANNHDTSYTFDELNRRTRITYANGSFEQTDYDASGIVAATVDPRNIRTEYTYDSINRLRKIQPLDSGNTPAIEQKYDAVGNPIESKTQIQTPTGLINYQTNWTYDSLNRRTREVIAGIATKEMSYDEVGNRTRLDVIATVPAMLSTTVFSRHAVEHLYDPLNRVIRTASAGRQAQYEYELGCGGSCTGSGNLEKIIRSNGVITKLTYDDASQLTSIRHERGSTGAALSFATYTYDLARNRDTMRDASGRWDYSYDSLNRLTKAQHPRWPDEEFTYDPMGNRKAQTKEDPAMTATVIFNNLDQITQRTESGAGPTITNYGWDAAGNLLSTSVQISGSPAILTTYTFDAFNRLRRVVQPTRTTLLGYDQKGQRVYESVGNEVQWTIYDGLNAVMELKTDKSPRSTHVPGLLDTRLDLAEPLVEWRIQDGLGSITQRTDDHGNVTADHFYEPFGSRQYGLKDPLHREGFTGHQHDDSLGLIYMNARWHLPNVGMFASRDPACSDRTNNEGTLYSYVANNPINAVDPTGKIFEWLLPLLLPTKTDDDNPPGPVEVDVEAEPSSETSEERPQEQPASERFAGEFTARLPSTGRSCFPGRWVKVGEKDASWEWAKKFLHCTVYWACQSCGGDALWSDKLRENASTDGYINPNAPAGHHCIAPPPGVDGGCK